MKKTLKNKWTEALKSKKFEQGTGAFCRNNQYCCLGVLCEISALPKVVVHNDTEYMGRSATFNHHMNEYFGLDYKQTNVLMDLNDAHRKTFDEIADWIETNIPGEPDNE